MKTLKQYLREAEVSARNTARECGCSDRDLVAAHVALHQSIAEREWWRVLTDAAYLGSYIPVKVWQSAMRMHPPSAHALIGRWVAARRPDSETLRVADWAYRQSVKSSQKILYR